MIIVPYFHDCCDALQIIVLFLAGVQHLVFSISAALSGILSHVLFYAVYVTEIVISVFILSLVHTDRGTVLPVFIASQACFVWNLELCICHTRVIE